MCNWLQFTSSDVANMILAVGNMKFMQATVTFQDITIVNKEPSDVPFADDDLGIYDDVTTVSHDDFVPDAGEDFASAGRSSPLYNDGTADFVSDAGEDVAIGRSSPLLTVRSLFNYFTC